MESNAGAIVGLLKLIAIECGGILGFLVGWSAAAIWNRRR